MREVAEETGVTGHVLVPLSAVEYWYNERDQRRIHKQVAYYLLSYTSGSTADFDASEVSGAAWFEWEEGLSKLSFDNERKVVQQARSAAEGLGLAPPHSEPSLTSR